MEPITVNKTTYSLLKTLTKFDVGWSFDLPAIDLSLNTMFYYSDKKNISEIVKSDGNEKILFVRCNYLLDNFVK